MDREERNRFENNVGAESSLRDSARGKRIVTNYFIKLISDSKIGFIWYSIVLFLQSSDGSMYIKSKRGLASVSISASFKSISSSFKKCFRIS